MPDATLTSPASPADVPYIHPDLAAAALAADAAGTGGLRLVPLAELTPDPANVRQHPERNLEAVEASLQRFGQRTPIVVQRQGMVVRAGNARLAVFKKLGWSHIAALVVDEGNVEAASYAI